MITQPGPQIVRYGAVLAAVMLLAACGSQPQTLVERPRSETVPASQLPGVGVRAASIALEQVGVPYRYGGSSTTGFDCSGLVQYAYARAGKRVPRTTGQLWSASTTVAEADLQPGDLLFFTIEGKMSHVGMYVGKRRFVHAPSSGRTVAVASVDAPYYSAALLRRARP